MAQGAIKKSVKPASSSHKAKKLAVATGVNGAPKRGARVTKAPRSAKAVKAHATTDKTMRKFTSGLIHKTEAMLGERAGHLELIGPGKKKGPDAKSREQRNKDKKGKMPSTGGSRKFG